MSHFEPIEPKSKEDIRAARAFLGWTQQKLASKIDCNTATINNLEKGTHIATKNIVKKLAKVFSQEGIKFNPKGGFLIEENLIQMYEGDECYLKLQDDILNLVGENDEVLYLGVEDKKSSEEIIKKHQKLYKKGIYPKYMINKNDNFIQGPLEDYKQIDNLFFVPMDLTVLFKGRVAIDLYREGEQTKKLLF